MNCILTLSLSLWPLLIKLVKVQYRTKLAELVGLRFLSSVFAKGEESQTHLAKIYLAARVTGFELT